MKALKSPDLETDGNESLWKITREITPPVLPANVKPLLFCGNGYLGVQAGIPFSEEAAGTFINGYYEFLPITYGEKAYGYPSFQQVMVPLPDVTGWEISETETGPNSGETPLLFQEGTVEIDMKRGVRSTRVIYTDRRGNRVDCKAETLTSLSSPHRLYIRTTIRGQGKYRLTRKITRPHHPEEDNDDPRKMESLGKDMFFDSSHWLKEGRFLIEEKTINSGLSYCCTGGLGGNAGKETRLQDSWEKESVMKMRQDYDLSESGEAHQTMVCVFMTSIEERTPVAEKAAAELEQALSRSWEEAAEQQEKYLQKYWRHSDIVLEDSPEFTRALRYCSFGLIQSSGTDRRRSASAKGLSSCGYNGHYFWDADVYVQGALNNIDPERAAALVEYRIDHLPEAIERCLELSEAGALYPWRTINGRESSAFFPAGTAQFHINADIIWGMKDYITTTGDGEILLRGGAEMLFQTARFWAGFADHVPEKGYCFHCVTGPDEYTALVNNNFYTNLMAGVCLEFAASSAEKLSNEYPEEMKRISDSISLESCEPAKWMKIARGVYLPKEEDTDVFLQDDAFSEKSPWNWDETPEEKRPLLLHYHPLKIYRHKVLKQPDVILGLLLERNRFSRETMGANFDYYDPLTSGDSSLSSAVQAAVGALAGRTGEALKHFRNTLFLDLEDLDGSTDNGIHLASMAGARTGLLYGFAGYRVTSEGPSFYPAFPAAWGRVSFSIIFRGTDLDFAVDTRKKTMTALASEDAEVFVNDRKISLKKNETRTISLD